MKNMQITGTGNSRCMKSDISEAATWEEFRAMLRAGTFTFDFNGINEAGIVEKGTPYDVENVLKDTTAALLGGDSEMVPDDAFVALKNLVESASALANTKAKAETGSYIGTGTAGIYNNTKIMFSSKPVFVAVWAGAASIRPSTSMAAWDNCFIWAEGVSKTGIVADSSNTLVFEQGSNYLKWYSNNATNQLNASGTEYKWFAVVA